MCCGSAYTEIYESLGQIRRLLSNCVVAIARLPGAGGALPDGVVGNRPSTDASLTRVGHGAVRARSKTTNHDHPAWMPRQHGRPRLRCACHTRHVRRYGCPFLACLSGCRPHLRRTVHSRTAGASSSLAVTPSRPGSNGSMPWLAHVCHERDERRPPVRQLHSQ